MAVTGLFRRYRRWWLFRFGLVLAVSGSVGVVRGVSSGGGAGGGAAVTGPVFSPPPPPPPPQAVSAVPDSSNRRVSSRDTGVA